MRPARLTAGVRVRERYASRAASAYAAIATAA